MTPTQAQPDAIRQAILLCQWISESPHQRGSINGLAAQVAHALAQADAQPMACEATTAQRMAGAEAWMEAVTDQDMSPTDKVAHVYAAMVRVAQQVQEPLLLKGIGKINCDGFKDTTRIGEVVYAWNRERPEPYKAGQFPRLGHPFYACSTEQFTFTPLTDDEAIAAIDSTIEGLQMKLSAFKHPICAGHFQRNQANQWVEVPRDSQSATKLYHAPGWPNWQDQVNADLVDAARAVVGYRPSMSYNESYFGEPPGLFKTRIANLERALPFREVKAAAPREADPLTQAIQRLNQNPYSLTKSECIDVLDKLRHELENPGMYPAAKG